MNSRKPDVFNLETENIGVISVEVVDDEFVCNRSFNGNDDQKTISNTVVYPNPTTGDITLETDEQIKEEVLVTVYDALGKKIKELTTASIKEEKGLIRINLSNIPNGVYWLKYENDNFKHSTEIVILK